MAKRKKKDIEVQAEPSIKLTEFTLKQDYLDRKKGDKVRLGVNGEQFYKSKNLI